MCIIRSLPFLEKQLSSVDRNFFLDHFFQCSGPLREDSGKRVVLASQLPFGRQVELSQPSFSQLLNQV